MTRRSPVLSHFGAAFLAALTLLAGCTSEPKPKPAAKPPAPKVVVPPPAPKPEPPPENLPPVMLGIDVLEADGFKAIAGKKNRPAHPRRRREPPG